MGLFPSNYNSGYSPVDLNALSSRVGYKRGISYDIENGDFLKDGQNRTIKSSGVDNWRQWCENCLATQRGKFRAYSTDFGVDYEKARSLGTRAEQEVFLRKEITEALLADDYGRTVSVNDIEFDWQDGDSVYIYVSATGLESADIDIKLIRNAN